MNFRYSPAWQPVESYGSALGRGVMPDKDGKLTAAEKATVSAWLNTKGKNHNCPVCATNVWSIGDHLLFGMPFYGGGLRVGGAAYPQVFLVCTNCAYTRHFMAVPVLGSVDLENRSPPAAKDEPKEAAGGG